jgi:hypothetical protein
MSAAAYLYVIRFGNRTKVGISGNVGRRLNDHARAARAAGVVFEHVLTIEPHAEARENEATLVRQFSTDGTEYLDAEPDTVALAALELRRTPAEVGPAPVVALPEPDVFTIADVIRAELHRRRGTEDAAAQAIGFSRSQWQARMEQPGRWRLGELSRVAELLGMSLEDLVAGGLSHGC